MQVYVQVNKEAEHNEDTMLAARDFFRQLEQHESEAVSLWQQFREITVDEYQRVYKVRPAGIIPIPIMSFLSWLQSTVLMSNVRFIFKSFQRLNVHFDIYSGESFHQHGAQEVVQQLQSRGLLKTSEYVNM